MFEISPYLAACVVGFFVCGVSALALLLIPRPAPPEPIRVTLEADTRAITDGLNRLSASINQTAAGFAHLGAVAERQAESLRAFGEAYRKSVKKHPHRYRA